MMGHRVGLALALAVLTACSGRGAGSSDAGTTGAAGKSAGTAGTSAAGVAGSSGRGMTGAAGSGEGVAGTGASGAGGSTPDGGAAGNNVGTAGAAGTGVAGAGAAGAPGPQTLTVPCGFVGPGLANDMTFSRDGSALLVGGATSVRTFDASTGKHVGISRQPNLWLSSFELSRDGQWIAAFGANQLTEQGGIALWRVSDPQGATILPSPKDFALGKSDNHVNSAAFSHDAKLLAASTNQSVFVFRISDATLVKRVDLGVNGAEGHVEFSADDKQVRLDGERLVLDAATLEVVSSNLDARPWPIGGSATWGRSDDGAVMISVDHDTAPYSVGAGSLPGTGNFATPDGAELTAATVSVRGTFVAAGDEKGRVYFTKVAKLVPGEPGPTLVPLQKQSQPILSVAISPDDKTVAAGSRDGSIYVWRVTDGAVLWHSDGVPFPANPQTTPFLLDASADGKRVATTAERDAYILDTTADRVLGAVATVVPSGLGGSSCKVDPGLQTVACAAGTINVGRIGATVASIPRPDAPNGEWPISLAPDGLSIADHVFVAGATVQLTHIDVVIWNTTTKTRRTLVASQASSDFAFSHDGKTLVGTGKTGVRFWDGTSGVLKTALGETDEQVVFVDRLALAPDEKTVATCGRQDLRLIDVATNKLRIISGPSLTGGCGGLAFSPDGTLVAQTRYYGDAPGTHVHRVADGSELWTIQGVHLGLAWTANRTLLRGEPNLISQWCLP
jgi:WD40 repeat protein